ncbi:MAG TPA: ammonium transporter, partial [Thermoguttaceae bacterium]|nr:ammonium transporter [Thermoguttaceae bacterium]
MLNSNLAVSWIKISTLAVALSLGVSVAAMAEDSSPAVTTPSADDAASVDTSVPDNDTLDTGDNAWMLVSSALVLLMTAPGLALFYCGLVRKKNVLGVMMQCVFLMCLMAIVWALWGYTLAFGGTGPYIGNFDYLLLNNVQSHWDEAAGDVYVEMAGSIPRLTHMLFQGMFFIITPALICGAFAERMKFSTMVVFMVLWGTLIYCPLCHWVWGGGILAFGVDGALGGGVLDFAGGAVVHISSGLSALVCALLIGKRLGFGNEQMPPHNLTYTTIGATLLWVGWFGFNGGSALAANGLAASAFAVTHFGAAAGGIAWAGMEWFTRGKPSILGTCSGVVAGLAGVTPTTGFVQPIHGILIGLVCGLVCFYACTAIKNR